MSEESHERSLGDDKVFPGVVVVDILLLLFFFCYTVSSELGSLLIGISLWIVCVCLLG